MPSQTMALSTLVLVVSGFMGGACSSTHQVAAMSPNLVRDLRAKHYDRALRVRVSTPGLEDVAGSLVLVGATDKQSHVRVEPGAFAARSLVLRRGEVIAIPNQGVTEVTVNDHTKGFFAGFGIGLVFTIGAAVLAAATYEEKNDVFDLGRGGDAMLIAGVVAGPALLTGMLVGGIVGWTTHYRF